jgi:hypothetical protein
MAKFPDQGHREILHIRENPKRHRISPVIQTRIPHCCRYNKDNSTTHPGGISNIRRYCDHKDTHQLFPRQRNQPAETEE